MAAHTRTRGEATTIRDIATKLNVSAVSVHRAIANKAGVSDELRRQILETAREMGYRPNYAAASLKRKPTRFAAVLPKDDGTYFSCIWDGLQKSFGEVVGLNVELDEFVCRDEAHQAELLKTVAENGGYDGVVTFSYSRMTQVLLQMQRLVAQGAAVVVIDDDMKEPEGLYCIPPNEKTVGRVAGEFISLITPPTGTVVVSEGRTDSKIHVNKLQSFLEYLREKKPGLNVRIAAGYSNSPERREQMSRTLEQMFREIPDVVAAYALTSLDNDLMVRAAQNAGADGRVAIVGTDLNAFTTRLLREGKLKAIINQGAFMKGYVGLQVLVERVVKNVGTVRQFECPIDIVLSSNLQLYRDPEIIRHW